MPHKKALTAVFFSGMQDFLVFFGIICYNKMNKAGFPAQTAIKIPFYRNRIPFCDMKHPMHFPSMLEKGR